MTIPLYIEAPNARLDRVTNHVLLAGGITGCYNWQADAAVSFLDAGYGVYNPRRANFPIDDPTASEAQIAWEYHALDDADAILFWFTDETLQPIALYELGRWIAKYDYQYKPIAVGTSPNYARRSDVEVQLRLACPDLVVYTNLQHTIAELKNVILPE